jgi:hypothetical protein|tara:strand:+ start:11890 stop:12261 length:372 start_codon:yes stop_codon:yes gene_type:complete
MLTNFKQLVKKHWSDMILAIFITLIALISFGIGRLVLLEDDQDSIIIQNPACPNTVSIQQSLINQPETEQGTFLSSVNSDKYHWPDCPWAKKISIENQVWFSSENEAQTAGYIRCGSFEKYIP